MKVLATQMGQYNQIMREPGEVFELLNFADGTYPHKTREVPKKDAQGKVIAGEFELLTVKGADKKTPVHRDFAPDKGNRLIKTGPMKGEVVNIGWMKAVPDRIPIGLYPLGVDFWTPNVQIPQAWAVPLGQQDRRASPILNVMPKPVDEDIEEFEDV